MDVLVAAGPGLVADRRLLEGTTAAECAALGVNGRFATAADVPGLRALLAGAGGGRALVVLPGPDPAARRLMETAEDHSRRTVWLDLARVGPLRPAGGAAHLQGRGAGGLGFAIRHAVHRLRHPARRIPYGDHPDQWGELRLPPSAGAGGRGAPVAMLVHGGYWRTIWGADLMDALAIDLAARGYAAWNLEYRRPDLHGWDATTGDLAAGLRVLRKVGGPLDLGRVAVIGHSAGGQLALRLAADTRAVAVAVSLAGVLDLVEGDRRHISNGAVPSALGGSHEEIPEVYAASSPLARLPLGVPQIVVVAESDDPDLVDFGRRYGEAAGEQAVCLEGPGDHFAVIDPAASIWKATAEALSARLGPGEA
ncbi:alpha/beta hydrolase family protein [Sphaerisporangium fuscum]|uniref:alpha/beta hydrolase family protein n=1 Tax=Sphaerisporangium fuscum TaxID=2835868 RepID=UPI001BDBD529|nr:alpha/beta hydrolase [Sphaerisporangium fuscum]